MTKKKDPKDLKKRGTKGDRQTRDKRAAKVSQRRSSPKAPDGLKPNQAIALCALLRGKTQVEAAKEAGMSTDGIAYLCTIPEFKAALNKAQEELRAKALIDADGIIAELMPALRADIREFFNDDGTLKQIPVWTEGMGKSIASIENEELFAGAGEKRTHVGYLRKVKFWPKVDAADKIAKIIGAYKPLKVEHSGRVDGVAAILAMIDGSDVGTGPSATRPA